MNSYKLDELIDKDLKESTEDFTYPKTFTFNILPINLFLIVLVALSVGFLLGFLNNPATILNTTALNSCEESLPRNEICVIESFNFKIKSKD